jgi:hypothetical protein
MKVNFKKNNLGQLLVILGFGLYASSVWAADSYSLEVASKEPIKMDANLAQWLKDHAEPVSVLDLPSNQFSKTAEKLQGMPGILLRLRYSNTSDKNDVKALAEALNFYQAEQDKLILTDPLAPYLLEEMLQSPKLKSDQRPAILKALDKSGAQSCPHKGLVLKEVTDGFSKSAPVDTLIPMLDKIFAFNSKRFRENALESFLDALPQDKQEVVRSYLSPKINEYPKLLEDNRWIHDGETKQTPRIEEPMLSLRALQKRVAGVIAVLQKSA